MEKLLTPGRSLTEIEATSCELVRNAKVLYPDLPAANRLQHVIELAEPEFLADLDQVLRAKHFLRVMRIDEGRSRREQRAAEWLFPEIREAALILGVHVDVGGGKTVARNELSFTDTGRALKALDKKDRDRRHNDAKRAALKTIRRLWPRSARARRMTLAEVDQAKAKKAGLT